MLSKKRARSTRREYPKRLAVNMGLGVGVSGLLMGS